VVSATTPCMMIAHVSRVEGKHAVAGQLETVTTRWLGELGPHNALFYYGIVLENGSNFRGDCQHVTNLLSSQCTID
jgi:hypothetical protein